MDYILVTCNQCRGTGRYVLGGYGSTNLETINCLACSGRGVVEYKIDDTGSTAKEEVAQE